MWKKEQAYPEDHETRDLASTRYRIPYEGVRILVASTEMYELPPQHYPQPPLRETVMLEQAQDVATASVDPSIAEDPEYVANGIAQAENYANDEIASEGPDFDQVEAEYAAGGVADAEDFLAEQVAGSVPEYLDSNEASNEPTVSFGDVGELVVAQFFSKG